MTQVRHTEWVIVRGLQTYQNLIKLESKSETTRHPSNPDKPLQEATPQVSDFVYNCVQNWKLGLAVRNASGTGRLRVNAPSENEQFHGLKTGSLRICLVLAVSLPAGFLPAEDLGYVFVNEQLPDAASLERAQAVMKRAEGVLLHTPDVARMTALSSFGLLSLSNGPNLGTFRTSTLRYRGGITTFLEVLDNQRSLYSAQLTLAQVRTSEYQSLVTLYRALGGGWRP